MGETNSRIIRGIIISSSIFWILFTFHIIFATNNLWFLFNLVAILIFVVSHFHSLITLYFSNLPNYLDKIRVIKYTILISIIYSTGYWYAVNDMQIAIWIFIVGLLPVLISIISMRYWITDN